MATFIHHELRLLNPSFNSSLLDVLTDLEYLRRLSIEGTTPISVFMQLKGVFHLLESLASARIEGNHTTLADYIESKVGVAGASTDPIREIENIEAAMLHVEASVAPGQVITEALIRELHHMTVSSLEREGDATPGAYRESAVSIAKSDHKPPDALLVRPYMEELCEFINNDDRPKYDLMKVALAHHRFAWIHPFGNGNGRVVRLLTYALLIKYGFRVGDAGRLLNPAAVFCADRNHYYNMLAAADSGSDKGLEQWCEYVLSGIRDELKKIDQLAHYDHLQTRILLPAIVYARQRQLVTAQEYQLLNLTVRKGVVKAADLAPALSKLTPSQRTYQIKKLLTSGMLQAIGPSSRQYTIGFSNNLLLRGVVHALRDEGFIPGALSMDQ